MKFLLAICCIVLLWSCQEDAPKKATFEQPKTIQPTTTAPPPSAKKLQPIETANLQPSSFVGDVPVFDSFEAIAPLFEQEDETTYVINFWATWCKPCVEELPYFEELNKKYADKNVKVILVSLDFKKQLTKKLLPFIQERQLKSEVLVLTDTKQNAWIDQVDEEWSGAIPITIVYNANERQFFEGQFANFAELNNMLLSLIS